MEDQIFKYSVKVCADEVKKSGSFTTLPVRINARNDIAVEASLRLLKDWEHHVNDGLSKVILTSNSPVGNLWALACAECPPEKLGIATYFSDIGFFYDDATEGSNEAAAVSKHFEDSFQSNVPTSQNNGKRNLGLNIIVAQVFLDAVAVDRERGLDMMECMGTGWLTPAKDAIASRDSNFSSIEEYYVYRKDDFGLTAIWRIVEFQFGWKPSEAEKTLIKKISDVIDEALMLTNDYWSWDREFEESRLYGHTLINAIEVYKQTQNVSTLVAQELVKSRIIACEKEYLRLKDEFYAHVPHSSLELKRWVEMLGYMLAGTNFWAASCPRHHSWKEHRNGVAPSMGDIRDSECDCGEIYSPDSIPVTPTSTNTSNYETKETSITDSVSAAIIPVIEGLKLQQEELPQVKDTWLNPPKNALFAPINYINSLPSKGIRAMLLQALSIWIKVSDSSLDIIESIIDSLHNASLILDDIEDNSPLRRGKLATHMVFGRSQSINSGNYMFVAALRSATKLSNPNALPLLLETLQSLYLGQSWDLYWKFNMKCPSEAEYLQMIDNKTGALFNLILQIAIGELSSPCDVNFQRFVQLFGRYFQIRDDYMNLCSQNYSSQKGLYEDLDEGKFSYPLVYLANKHPENMDQVLGIFRQRPTESSVLSMEAKAQIIDLLNSRGVLESVLKYLQELELDIEVEISKLEDAFGERNPLLRLILVRLSMDDVTMSS